MSILGIDYGDKKIGLAKSAGGLAVPLKIIENKGNDFVLSELKQLCQENNISKIVVGIPVSLSGRGMRKADENNVQMKKVLQFIDLLRRYLPDIEVVTEDERLSTQEAQKMLKGVKKGEKEDAVSAMLILQNYLDKNF